MPGAEYNGWSSYETWLVNLWLGNERGSYEYWRDYTADALERHQRDVDASVLDIATHLKDEFETSVPEDLHGMWGDLIRSALAKVNWFEIARHWCED